MFGFRFNTYSRGSARRVLYYILSGVIAASLCSSPAVWAKGMPASATSLAKPDPDAQLIEIYKELNADHLDVAQAKADALVRAYPNFRLGQMLRGDLLLMHTHTVASFGPANGPEDKLKDLRDEAIVRLKALRERPDPNLVPSAVLQLRDDQKHVLVVDAGRSRLYEYENHGGQLKFINDYYITQGKLGVNKTKAGDQKTPLGVYYITARLPGSRLPNFYGTGALPINYPNEWDRLNGRSGSGIWLHGTPSNNYSRPPLASDGCVVLTNPDINKLYSSVEVGKTPVIISDHVEFVNKAKLANDRNFAAALVEGWRSALESLDANRLLQNYSQRFKSEHGEDLNTWFAKQEHLHSGIKKLTVKLRDLTLFFYPGRNNMIVSTFTEDALYGQHKNTLRKRQYWIKEGATWKIISESTL
jgi:murein L,D-transpeptidase YafK